MTNISLRVEGLAEIARTQGGEAAVTRGRVNTCNAEARANIMKLGGQQRQGYVWRPPVITRRPESVVHIIWKVEGMASVARSQEGVVTIARRPDGVANISVRQEGMVSIGKEVQGKAGAIRRPGHGEMPTRRLTCMWRRCCRGWCSRRPR